MAAEMENNSQTRGGKVRSPKFTPMSGHTNEVHIEEANSEFKASYSTRTTRDFSVSVSSVEFSTRMRKYKSTTNINSRSKSKSASLLAAEILLNLLLASTIINLLQSATTKLTRSSQGNNSPTSGKILLSLLPISSNFLLFAEGATAAECTSSDDCRSDKICHENKCICGKERPIEDQDRCLAHAQIGELCTITEQCLGNSICLEALCSCGTDGISIYNPSSRINYCHPKRKLNESCTFDTQCPANAYCSTKAMGCLCSNGYGQLMVSMNGVERAECLPKTCTDSSNCESEYHHCEDNRCVCDATHWDPTTARCYKFGSLGRGESNAEGNVTTSTSNDDYSSQNDDTFHSILKDLMENSDKLWVVIILLIILTTFIFLLIFMLLRRHYLGYCWTAHKKEYEPNNENNADKNGAFNKNSINNKSFKRKNGDAGDNCDNNNLNDSFEDDERAGLASSRGATGRTDQENHHRIDMSNNRRQQHDNPAMIVVPLKSSTSTPV